MTELQRAQLYGTSREIRRAEDRQRLETVRAKMAEDAARTVSGAFTYEKPAGRRGRYPGPGNSETVMRNRVLRAASFGLTHDGRYA